MLARGGARVALVDRAGFPRDKACGDLIGPRGVQTLRELGIDVPGAPRLGDMAVIGPSGSRGSSHPI
jgi:flavin-dependent dehydrogenase